MRVDTSADVRRLLDARPEGYARARGGAIHVLPSYERRMHALWDRSGLVSFSDWDPPRDREGLPAVRWHQHYGRVVLEAVRSGRLTENEGKRLLEYLDVVGT